MFEHASLIRAAQIVDALERPVAEAVASAVRGALRRQVDIPTQRPLRYPAEEDAVLGLRRGLEALPAGLVPLGCRMLLEPQLIVPRTEPRQVDDTVEREVSFLSVGVVDEHTAAVTIDIRATTSGTGKFAATTTFDVAISTFGEAELADELEALFLRATPAVQADAVSRAPRAMWLGGDREDGTFPEDGPSRIVAVLAVRGYRAEVVQRPLRSWSDVKERLDNEPPLATLIWTPYATPAPYDEIAAGRFAVLHLDEVDFDEALMLARLLLDELGEYKPAESSRPHDWATFDARISDLECDAFVVTENAREGIKTTGYPHPARMWDHIEALARAARIFRERGGVVGDRLAEWLQSEFGLEVALHDDNLADAQKNFTHDGNRYSREPHVKVDDAKAWIEVGRIYFAVDSGGTRFIVDHIGGKLY